MCATMKGSRSVQILLFYGVFCFLQFIENVEGITAFEKDLSLSYSEKVTLDRFKERVAHKLPHDYMADDIYLVRWLRAKNFNIEQAEQMLNENLRWRNQNRMDTILNEDWSEFRDKYPVYLDTVNREGMPILTSNFGDWDVRASALAGRMPKLIRYLSMNFEDAATKVRQFQNQGKNVSQYDFLINMENYNLIQQGCPQCMVFFVSIVQTYENHYPGFANNMVLFNTPAIFELVLRVIRPLMSQVSRDALKVYGQDKAQWSKALLKIADKSQLRPEYGGVYRKKQR
ncbi:unnamed protein product [Orchesella dallaii]|uniref:CRAL-TRIO domain-containing protein n=1 Tax=Orchesella dallaii TaxID=48710 RepID=A0ABP1Q1H4_9HEXA